MRWSCGPSWGRVSDQEKVAEVAEHARVGFSARIMRADMWTERGLDDTSVQVKDLTIKSDARYQYKIRPGGSFLLYQLLLVAHEVFCEAYHPVLCRMALYAALERSSADECFCPGG